MDELPGIVWTRERLLQAAGFEAVEYVRHALMRDRETLDAVLPEKRIHRVDKQGRPVVEVHEGGAPDYDARLRASEHIYDLADVRKARADNATDPSRPIAVTIVLAGSSNGHDAGAALQSHGVRLHLDSHNGDSA